MGAPELRFVEYDTGTLIEANVTMTHVLNFSLRKVLGDKVDKKGSSVYAENLRYDFWHKKDLTVAELKWKKSQST